MAIAPQQINQPVETNTQQQNIDNNQSQSQDNSNMQDSQVGNNVDGAQALSQFLETTAKENGVDVSQVAKEAYIMLNLINTVPEIEKYMVLALRASILKQQGASNNDPEVAIFDSVNQDLHNRIVNLVKNEQNMKDNTQDNGDLENFLKQMLDTHGEKIKKEIMQDVLDWDLNTNQKKPGFENLQEGMKNKEVMAKYNDLFNSGKTGPEALKEALATMASPKKQDNTSVKNDDNDSNDSNEGNVATISLAEIAKKPKVLTPTDKSTSKKPKNSFMI